jgi:hypothetical protein
MSPIRCALVALTLACAPALFAQSDDSLSLVSSVSDSADAFLARADTRHGCFNTIAPSTMHRAPVYLQARMPPHTDTAFTSQADLMAQDVAAELRTLFGAHGAEVPSADSIMAWYAVPSRLTVIAHADGRVTRYVRSTLWDTTASVLLARAFDVARAHNTALMLWPENSTSDSVIVRLSLRAPSVTDTGVVTVAGDVGIRFTVFSLLQPERFPALPLEKQGYPRYPVENERRRVSGSLLLQFEVDTAGKVDPKTIHDVWPAAVPRLTGEPGRYYDSFVDAVASWAKHARFSPSRIGTCPVRQTVQLPIKFVTPESAREDASRKDSH